MAKEIEQEQSFYQRHYGKMWLLGTLAFTTAAFFTIWATAGMSLPFIATTAGKIGLDFGFLSTLSVPAASAVGASIVTGATFVSVVAARLTSSIVSSIFRGLSRCFCRNKQEETTQGDDQQDETLDSHVGLRRSLGGQPEEGKLVTFKQEEDVTPVNDKVLEETPEPVTTQPEGDEIVSSNTISV
jgi:hypothetical protein